MYVCWDVHQDTYIDIWVGRIIIIRCQDNNLLCCSTNLVISLVLPQLLSSGLHQISDLWSLFYFSCLHPVLPLVFYSTSLLLLSYHTMSIPYLISLALYLLAPVRLCPRHDFQYMFMIRIYRYTCAYLCSPLGICITTHRGVLTPLDPHV